MPYCKHDREAHKGWAKNDRHKNGHKNKSCSACLKSQGIGLDNLKKQQEPPWSKGHPSPLDLETMSVPCELLSQCLEITKQLITLNQKAAINIRIGSEFIFSFNNQEISEKKKSPSQIKRNLERNETFKNMKKRDIGDQRKNFGKENRNKRFRISDEQSFDSNNWDQYRH